jgi:hypothetical protein
VSVKSDARCWAQPAAQALYVLHRSRWLLPGLLIFLRAPLERRQIERMAHRCKSLVCAMGLMKAAASARNKRGT